MYIKKYLETRTDNNEALFVSLIKPYNRLGISGLDWSGAKLSKSLYVKKGAYGDIPKRFINYSFLKEDLGFKGLDILYDIVINWINNPYMLFRHYSIYYFIKEFEKYE